MTLLKFIDLFAGLGGFHLALAEDGHKCVFASELDPKLRELYELNFGLQPEGDIKEIGPETIPDHDVLCAGFPCQSYSKAGSRLGRECPEVGDLINYVVGILDVKRPDYFLLENVPNLEKHDGGKTWIGIKTELEALEYEVETSRYSPHHFGIPQVRDRMFIVGSRKGLAGFEWPKASGEEPNIRRILDENPKEAKPISTELGRCLDMWQAFLDAYPAEEKLPSFPIWAMEFGADYPTHVPPATLPLEELRRYCGAHGVSLDSAPTVEAAVAMLPKYARGAERFPTWKQTFIRQNRALYEANKEWLDGWRPKLLDFPASLQKFEWNCKRAKRRLISDLVIQIRASGVRVKMPTTAPSLIASTTTQVPIIGWEGRYMTPRECAALQNMEGLKKLPATDTAAYKALGNAVNAALVRRIARALLLGERSGVSGSRPVQYELGIVLARDSEACLDEAQNAVPAGARVLAA